MIPFIWWIWLSHGEVCICLSFQTSSAALNLLLRKWWYPLSMMRTGIYIYIYIYVSDACYLEEFFHLSQLLDFLGWYSLVLLEAESRMLLVMISWRYFWVVVVLFRSLLVSIVSFFNGIVFISFLLRRKSLDRKSVILFCSHVICCDYSDFFYWIISQYNHLDIFHYMEFVLGQTIIFTSI